MANTKKYVSLDKLGLYDEKIKGVISAGDAAALQSAKDYADGLAGNYDAAGSAATAEANAKAYAKDYADGKDAAIAEAKKAGTDAQAAASAADAKAVAAQGEVDALETYVGTFTHDTAKTVVEYVNAKTDGIATSGNLEALAGRVTAVEGDVSTIKGDYLKAADKTELEGKISAAQGAAEAAQGEVDALEQTHATDKKNLEDAIALKADQTALDGVSAVANAAVKQADYDVKVKALDDEDVRIAGLVATEQARAEGIEAGLEERLVEVEAFFKTTEEETLDTALDTLVELQKYLSEEGAVADQMLLDIAANAKAIEDHEKIDHNFAAADATLKSELEGKIALKADASVVEGVSGKVTTLEGKMTTVEGKVSTLESEMDAVEDAVATKVEQEAYNTKVAALEEADADQVERIAALEAKFGDGDDNVSTMISTAKQEAIAAAAGDATSKANKALEDAKAYADAEDAKIEERVGALETASAKHALASDLEALDGRVGTAEGEIDTLQGEMDAVEALADAADKAAKANAQAIALKADITALNAVSDRVTTLETWHNNFTEVSEEEINSLFA